MESAPLTLAWEHAKAASAATQIPDTTAALTSHALAAGEFARAAEGASNNEAIRTLKLLENHHRQLGELLKFSRINPTVTSTVTDKDIITKEEKPVSTSAAVAELRAKSKDDAAQQLQRGIISSTSRRTSTSTFPRRMPPREMSSSIASNLASARGIRSVSTAATALPPSITTTDAPGTMGPPPSRRRPAHPQHAQTSAKPSWLPPTKSESDASINTARRRSAAEASRRDSRDDASMAGSARDHAREQQTTLAEDGFAKFYSAFESLRSKLSAPLAFAGLPLISEEDPSLSQTTTQPSASAPTSRFSGRRATTTNEPDLTKYFSKAAIKASLTTSQAAVNDSFYVVPTSGGTVSYAQMVGYEEQAKDRDGNLRPDLDDDAEDDDFVDAREHPVTATLSRGNSGGFRASFGRKSEERHDGKTSQRSRGSQGNLQEELMEKNKFLEQAIVEMRDALSKEQLKLRKYQMESQAGTQAISNMLHESGVLARSAASSVHGGMGGSVFGALAGVREAAGAVDVEILRKEIDSLRAEVGREKRLRRKLESDAQKDKYEKEKEKVEVTTEMEKLRQQIEAFRGDAMKYRQLEKSAREKAERRRREGKSERDGSGRGGSEGKGDGNGNTPTKAADGARFLSG